MIEKTVLDYMTQALSVPVYMEIPPEQPGVQTPASFVVIQKLGSTFTNRLDTATMAFQSYSKNSLLEAARLNESVKAAVENMVSLATVSNCFLNSDYNFTDTRTKRYRYQALYVITYLREEV